VKIGFYAVQTYPGKKYKPLMKRASKPLQTKKGNENKQTKNQTKRED